MSFDLNIPLATGAQLNLSINIGDKIFIMGANGTGKSSLMQHLYRSCFDANVRWISAHRQNWFISNTIDLSSQQKRDYESGMRNGDITSDARYKDNYASYRPSITISDLINAVNLRSRAISDAVDEHNIDGAQTLSKNDSLIRIINEILYLSNIPIKISVHENDQLVASKCGGIPYSVAELSDGERNAFLIAANVLTVKSNTLVLIDEPERHLHRSIISPLLTHLFSKRNDCAFIVSTHDVMLPLDDPSTRTLLIRGCTYAGSSLSNWDVDMVSPQAEIDDDIKKDILGARRKILFVEGTENSLDKPLYSLVFPNTSIIAKSSCRDVENIVSSIRDSTELHWVNAFGIVDNDRRSQSDITRLNNKGIYVLPVFSVESIYYHPHIQGLIAQRQADLMGGQASTYLANAKIAAMQKINEKIQSLSIRTAEKTIREKYFFHTPKIADIENLRPVEVSINVSECVEQELERLNTAVNSDNYMELMLQYPVRETGALANIAKELKFQKSQDYERAVLKLLMDNTDALNFVKTFLGSLVSDMQAV